MKIYRILFWTLLSLSVLSGVVRGSAETADLPVRVEGPAATVVVEDAKGQMVSSAVVGGGQTHTFQVPKEALGERTYSVRLRGSAADVRYDTRVYDVTVCSYLDEQEQETSVWVVTCDGKKQDSVLFRNQKEDKPVPGTGDASRTPLYLGLVLLSAGGLGITTARRLKDR